jgi:hypothetical protein
MPGPSPDTGPPTRVVSTAAASNATARPSSGTPSRRLGLAFIVIATAQPMHRDQAAEDRHHLPAAGRRDHRIVRDRGLQPARRRPAGRRLDRAGHSWHRRPERGGQQLAIPHRLGSHGRQSRRSSADRRDAEADHRPRLGHRLLAGLPGLRGDRPAGADHLAARVPDRRPEPRRPR